ncbi:hypothetical protein CDL60_06865 [Roseateles noduli]|nr:hypothetical protein CDL60_06865 [Roseateles noduli]
MSARKPLQTLRKVGAGPAARPTGAGAGGALSAAIADSPRLVAQRERLSAMKPVPAGAGAPVQLKWLDRGGDHLEWDPPADGVRWFYVKATGAMFYIVEGGDKRYLPLAGPQQARPRDAWAALHGADPMADQDASVVPARRTLPSVVELGAGEGRFSPAFSRKFGGAGGYLATDIAPSRGDTGFLSHAREAGIDHRFGVNANEVDRRFAPQSLTRLVAANPYGGGRDQPGASFGLMTYLPGGRMVPDDRFLSSARRTLAPGGRVDIYGRTNTLGTAKRALIAEVPKKSEMPKKEERSAAGRLIKAQRDEVARKYPVTNENPHLNIKPDQLSALAKATGFRVKVKRAKQPRNVVEGGDPDTKGLAGNDREGGLKDFTTRFTFTPAEDGYQSDEEHPRVDYDSDEASDWDEDEASDWDEDDVDRHADLDSAPTPWNRVAPDANAPDRPGRTFGAMAAEIEQDIDRRELDQSLSPGAAAALRAAFRPRVELLIDTSIKRIRSGVDADTVVNEGIATMLALQGRFME